MQWSNMPVNEVVVNVFSTSFGGLWLQMAITTMRRHAGVREYDGLFLQTWENFIFFDQTVNVNSPSLM